MSKGNMNELTELKEQISIFNRDRDWRQFHSPKNLSMALSVEASEIVEIFQWMESEESYDLSSEKLEKLEGEIADVLLYLLQLSAKFEIDPVKAASRKLQVNEKKYPIEKAKGSAKKYNEF